MSRAEKVCWTLAAFGAFFAVGPFMFEGLFEPLGDWRFAGVLLGIWIGITAAIVSRLFKGRGRAKARLLQGKGLLAHWIYTEEEWKGFTEQDYGRSHRAKWFLFGIVAFWCVLFGILFPIFDPDAGWVVTWVMAGVLVLIALVIVAGTWLRRAMRRHATGEVRIGKDALVMSGGELHVWKGWGAHLESVGVVPGSPPCLEITYTVLTRTGNEPHSVRIPIPAGKDTEAAAVAEQLLTSISS